MAAPSVMSPPMEGTDFDIAILGGGLSGGLVALALARLRPELRLLVIDQGAHFGGNHVWSSFGSDIAAADRWLVEPLLDASWPRYEVRFPRLGRIIDTPYRSLTSERIDAALRAALPAGSLLNGAEVISAGRTAATLADGRRITAGAVIDARGATRFPHLLGGWQKFLGRMLRLDRPHGLAHPILMDGRVAQRDGFRFVYCLPFSADTLFIEDTYYADTPGVDAAAMGGRIDEYCRFNNWRVAEVLREEQAALPVVAGGDFAAFWAAGEAGGVADGPARIGVRAGLFHPLTGYSLPLAVRTALAIAALPKLSAEALARATRDMAHAHWRESRYYRVLARMLFAAAVPNRRYRVFEHFYRLGTGLIERFYAGQMTHFDRLRVLTGKPPVSLGRALAGLGGGGLPLARLDLRPDLQEVLP